MGFGRPWTKIENEIVIHSLRLSIPLPQWRLRLRVGETVEAQDTESGPGAPA